MALVNYKNIVDRKGYLVDEDDREIFEQELVKTNFGLNIDDHIEFILYDSAENQLPQGDDGKLVRYIPIDDTNIRTYFLATKSNQTKKKNDSFEYFVDVEKLIKEAGYSNGLYKTSVSIVNRRVGREDLAVNEANKGFDNKLYIQEVSPTRTEIRVLPIKRTGKVNDDLNLRYSIFTRESNFRDDTIYYVNEIIESVKVENVLRNFITSKGKVATGQNYINLIKREFGINNFEDFIRRIEQDWKKSLKYFTENREWRINQNDYGQPLSSPINPELGERQLQEVCRTSLILIIEKYLPKRDYTPRNIMTEDELKTFDKVQQLLRTLRSNRELTSSEIKAKQPLVRGCTDPNALNFNASAQDDDGSCRYRYENVEGSVLEPTPSPPPPPPTTQAPLPPPPTTQSPPPDRELILNGDFSSLNNWTLNGNMSIRNGKLLCEDKGTATQQIKLDTNTEYGLRFDASSGRQFITIKYNGVDIVNEKEILGGNSYNFEFTPSEGDSSNEFVIESLRFDREVKLDNIILEQNG